MQPIRASSDRPDEVVVRLEAEKVVKRGRAPKLVYLAGTLRLSAAAVASGRAVKRIFDSAYLPPSSLIAARNSANSGTSLAGG